MTTKKKRTKKPAPAPTETPATDVAVILATGPSLNAAQLALVREAQKAGKVRVFGMNHIWKDYPDLDGFLACNYQYYEYYWDEGLKYLPCDKWTWHEPTAKKYGLKYIDGKWAPGLSTDPAYIHYGHSSGFQVPGIAYHAGARKMILLGYDMSYAPDYNGRSRQIGSKPRHYFKGGEYPTPLQHWPSVKVRRGVFVELIDHFAEINTVNPDVTMINCSPGSAMTCFPMMDLEVALADL